MFARIRLALALVCALLLPTWPVGTVASAAQAAAVSPIMATDLIPLPASRYAFPASAVGDGFHEVDRQERPDGRAFINRIVAPDAQPVGTVWVSSTNISFVDTRVWVFASTEEATAEMDTFLANMRTTFNVEPAVGWGADQAYSYAYRSGQAMYRGIAIRHHNATMALSVAGLEQYATWDNTARLARIVEASFLASVGTAATPPPAPTQPPAASAAPAVGSVVLADPLTGPGKLIPGTCPTGRNKGEFVGEGFIFKVTGRCSPSDPIAAVIPPQLPVSFADGEVRVEFKAVSGQDRASVVIGVREQGQRPEQAYQAIFLPAANGGVVSIGVDGGRTLAQQESVGALSRDDWNGVALRAQGSRLWVLLNDQVILTADDAAYDRGSVYLAVRRLGDPDDGQESAVVFRNLRISALADGAPDRAPTLLANP